MTATRDAGHARHIGRRREARTGTAPLAEPWRSALLGIVRATGEVQTAAALGCDRATVLRAAAGLGLRRGTRVLIEHWLRERGHHE